MVNGKRIVKQEEKVGREKIVMERRKFCEGI
jgi:hypothetical protein